MQCSVWKRFRQHDRFTVLNGPEEYADHILDMADVQPEEDGDELGEMVSALRWGMPGELLCSHGSKSYGTDLVSLSEYAAEQGLTEIDFEGDAPEGMCWYCWSNTRETLADTVGRNDMKILGTPRCRNSLRTYVRQYEEAEREDEGVADRIGTVGYRLRWK